MKELSRKTYFTIFGILSAFLFLSVVIMNVQSYRREYEGVKRNLHSMDEHDAPFQKQGDEQIPADIENMRIMDYEVYTIELSNGKISRIISHGNEATEFHCRAFAEKIIKKEKSDTFYIGNLYFAEISYHYMVNNKIILLNNEGIREKLRSLLMNTAVLFVVIEVMVGFLSKVITGWITRPAKEAFRSQREFIADASHELKTPLAVIMASSDELLAQGDNEKYVENIRYESERMNKLITGLLNLSKLEEGVSRESFCEENFTRIVRKACLTFEGVAFEQGVCMETELEENVMISCSKEEMEKLLSTLLDNAIKHSDKDSTIVTTLNKEKNSIILEVINEGEPIQEGDEERIFERFYRADKSRSRAENRYGLGLAIAKSIVKNHNGSIRAYSKDGKTTFRVELLQNVRRM